MTNQASKLTPAAPQSAQLGPNVYRGDDGVDRVLGISSGLLPPSDQPAQGGKRLSNDAFIDFRDDGYVSFSGRTIIGELTTLVLSPEEFSMLSIVLSAPASQQVAPAPEGLREAASKFAARVRERCPEWFEESDTDFSEADHALRATLAQRTPTAPGKGGK